MATPADATLSSSHQQPDPRGHALRCPAGSNEHPTASPHVGRGSDTTGNRSPPAAAGLDHSRGPRGHGAMGSSSKGGAAPKGASLWTPVTTRKPKPEGMESWDTEDVPDTESEDEAWGNERRRRTAATPMDSTTPPTARRGPGLSSGEPPQQEGAGTGLDACTRGLTPACNRCVFLEGTYW